ncbi:MAG TPA: T9SS type A sorting domain-containing protein [Bacteroidia bacterium]|nr:T9SS type A sorting domain-containing protein [Bacteroidia bacterium]
MYVSKANILIEEIKGNSNVYDDNASGLTPKTREMFRYALDNYFSYIAIYSLAKANPNNPSDPSPLIGNSAYAPAIRAFLQAAHLKGIRVGFVITSSQAIDGSNVPIGSNTGYMNYVTSEFYYDFSSDLLQGNCNYAAGKSISNGNGGLFAAKGEYPDSLKINPLNLDFFNVNRSEMIKQALRLLKYSYDTKAWLASFPVDAGGEDEEPIDPGDGKIANTHANNINKVPPLATYLFDFISLEYEYWNGAEYNNFGPPVCTTGNCETVGTISRERIAWNTFVDVSEAIFFVYKKMCSYLNTELEFQLKPATINDFTIPNYNSAEGFFDPNWGQIPPSEVQIAFITKYFNRVLLSDYKNGTVSSVNDIISRTVDAQTIFEQNQGTVGNNKNIIIPLFSAEDALEERHDFGNQSAYLQGPPCSPCTVAVTAQPFFGKLLKQSPPQVGLPWQHPLLGATVTNPYLGNTLAYFEQEFIFQSMEAQSTGRVADCAPYSNASPTPCNFSITNNAIGGFMWFKYEFLNNPFRINNEYHRKFISSNEESKLDLLQINYNKSTFSLEINLANDNEINQNSIQLFDISGKAVLNGVLQSGKNSILLDNLNNGVYIYSITTSNKVKNGKICLIRD